MDQQEFEELLDRIDSSDANDAEQTYRNAIDSSNLTKNQEKELQNWFKQTRVHQTGNTGDHDDD